VKKFQSDRIDADLPLPGGDFCRPVRSPWCRDAPTRARTGNPHYGPRNAICSSLSGRLHGAAARRGPVLRDFIAAVTPVNEAALNPTLRAEGAGSARRDSIRRRVPFPSLAAYCDRYRSSRGV
jgi:hypothetical protein